MNVLRIRVAYLQATILILSALEEFGIGVLAVMLFLLPGLMVLAAVRDGICTDFGCWFWIERDGLKICRRHQLRSFANFS